MPHSTDKNITGQENVDSSIPEQTETKPQYSELTKDYVSNVETALREDDIDKAHDLTLSLRPADIADLLEYLDRNERALLIEAIGSDLNGAILTELDPRVRDHILTLLQPKIIADIVSELETSDSVYLLENVPPIKLQEICLIFLACTALPLSKLFNILKILLHVLCGVILFPFLAIGQWVKLLTFSWMAKIFLKNFMIFL